MRFSAPIIFTLACGVAFIALFQNCGHLTNLTTASATSASSGTSATGEPSTVVNTSTSTNTPHGAPTVKTSGTGCADQYCVFVTGANFDSLCDINVLDYNWKLVESHSSSKNNEICSTSTELSFALGAAGKTALLNGGLRITVINPGDKNWNTIGAIHRTPSIKKDRPAVGMMAQLLVEYMMPAINTSVVNAPDLLTVQKKLNQKLVIDAANAGATYVTITVPGFTPLNPNQLKSGQNDLILWQTNPDAYWEKFDQAIGMVEEQNLAYVIRDWNDFNIFPTLAGENQHEFITNPQSKSYLLYLSYWNQLITRYAGRPGLLQIGVGGESNLCADLDMVSRCKNGQYGSLPGWCDAVSNYTTAELIAFYVRTLPIFRSYAPNVQFASELGLNQINAFHLSQTPEWLHDANSGIFDTYAQGSANLLSFVSLFDVQGQHNYNGDFPNPRWGYTPADRVDAHVTSDLVKPIEKGAIYFGELGENPFFNSAGQETNAQDQINRPYTLNILSLMPGWGGATRATLWGWEFNVSTNLPYQHIDQYFDFSPPYFSFLQKVQGYNAVFGQPTLSATTVLKVPNVVIVWPVTGLPIFESSDSSIANNFVAVSASANSNAMHAITKVVVSIDGVAIGSTTTYPFRVSLPPGFGSDKSHHVIQATAYDSVGLSATDTANWH